MQVDKAWEFLEKAIDLDIPDVRYDVQLQRSTGGPPGRGVYIREPMDTQKATVWNVTVSPQLHEVRPVLFLPLFIFALLPLGSKFISRQDADVRKEKLAVEDRIRLVSSADWVTCPEGLLVTYNGRSFKIGVDSTHLSPGVHYAEVHGSDTQYPSRGILFRVPITVCIPLQVSVYLADLFQIELLAFYLNAFLGLQGKPVHIQPGKAKNAPRKGVPCIYCGS